jgi:hypothetical protein
VSEPQSYRFTADGLAPGTHRFRLKQIDRDGSTTLSEVQTITIQPARLVEVTGPNPLRDGTRMTVEVRVETAQPVDVGLYNVLGQRVRTLHTGELTPGQPLSADVSPEGLPSGLYILRVQGASVQETQKFSIVR